MTFFNFGMVWDGGEDAVVTPPSPYENITWDGETITFDGELVRWSDA